MFFKDLSGLEVRTVRKFVPKISRIVTKEKEAKARYVTDSQYWAQLELVCAMDAPWIPVFYEFAYMCAARSIEVRDLTVGDVTLKRAYMAALSGLLKKET